MKQLMKTLLRHVGYEIRKYRPTESIEQLAAHVAQQRGTQTVVDVGANAGQFGRSLRAAGYRRRIISVEPLAEPHRKLQQAAASDNQWQVAGRVALGAEEKQIESNRFQNTFSSSILGILPAHTASAPHL